jgi:1-acyl-sn-glycerol-3-phosphate acyltransferase
MYIITHILVLIFIPIGLILALCKGNRIVGGLKQLFGSLLLGIIGKNVRVIGLENVATKRKYLVVSNYPSAYVTFAMMKFLPGVTFVADDFILKIPLLGLILKHTGAIFVDQKNPRKTKRAIDAALDNPHRNMQYLLIYPEGKRSTDGRIGAFKYGFKYILRRSSYDLLPVTANGFYRLKPARRVYLDPYADLELIFHEPIANDDVRSMTNKQLISKTEDAIRSVYRA